MKPTISCDDDARREAVRAKPELNGLDYVEVGDDRTTLTVYFLGKAPQELDARQGESADEYARRVKRYWQIVGGARIRDIQVVDVEVTRNDDPELDDYAVVRVDHPGDFSTYTLQVVGMENIDALYDHVEFSFQVDCPNPLDCAEPASCPPPERIEPDINYLAKDYATFRQLILDRLALIMPDWQERHAPDLGITLIEVLAYAGDYLSYYQDAVATEAYLDTARQRISVRRHARLVDYALHEGCSARAWLHITTDTDLALNPRDVFFITGVQDLAALDNVVLAAEDLREIPLHAYEVFEAARAEMIQLYAAHSEIYFYAWGQRECCLPRGATGATLRDEIIAPPPDQPEVTAAQPQRKLQLRVGDVLIFEEALGPRTGNPADADPVHRHAVRLIKVTPGVDALTQQPIVEIEWGEEDALPFALCISSITAGDAEPPCAYLENVSVARGNVILVDHGLTIEPCEELGKVRARGKQTECDCIGRPAEVTYIPERFRPHLEKTPLAFRQPLPADDPANEKIISAAQMLSQDVRQALPAIELNSILGSPEDDHVVTWAELNDAALVSALGDAGFTALCYKNGLPLNPNLFAEFQKADAAALNEQLRAELVNELAARYAEWTPQSDLLESGTDDRDFVVEMDNDRVAHLRFGDDECGEQPKAGTTFYASYRVGGGTRGNVGAEAITHLVTRRGNISGANLFIRNPMPAQGGMNAESIAEAKLFAPTQFRQVLERAVIADDYAQLAESKATHVQRAAAQLIWSGSWYEADVAIDPVGGVQRRGQLSEIQGMLERYRRIGHDLHVEWAEMVPIELELDICVLPSYLRGHVLAALRDAFSNRVLSDGRRGFFHPDNLTFGEGIYLSRLVAAAQAVTGVESVRVTKLNRLFELPNRELENGVLPLAPLQIAQLDNDPSFPERGKLTFILRGGR